MEHKINKKCIMKKILEFKNMFQKYKSENIFWKRDFTYMRILCPTWWCNFEGACTNWMRNCIEKLMSSLVFTKYSNLLVVLLYIKISWTNVFWSNSMSYFFTMGVVIGFALNILVPAKISRAYFHWKIWIYFLVLAISSPEKNFRWHRSFILKVVSKELLTTSILFMLFQQL